MLMTSDCLPLTREPDDVGLPPSSGELAAARLAWALAALDLRHEPEVLRMALALLPTVSAEVLRTALHAANACSSAAAPEDV